MSQPRLFVARAEKAGRSMLIDQRIKGQSQVRFWYAA
jgi:hypothetical protein